MTRFATVLFLVTSCTLNTPDTRIQANIAKTKTEASYTVAYMGGGQ